MIFQREGKALFFLTFNITVSDVFAENYSLNYSKRLEDMKIFSVSVKYFHYFFGFFDISCYKKVNDVSM